MTHTLPCITCPAGCILSVTEKNGEVISVTGNSCERGDAYGRAEVTAPTRIVTSNVKVRGGSRPVVSVRTTNPVPKDHIQATIDLMKDLVIDAPVTAGDVVIENVADTGVDLIATYTVR
ncbi:MAG: DUF1667 domain-containing protein [Lachnospiraceae bacterium]|nr:DUF1667 domain-containing protein [Lachnospiraceae bacterium]